MSRPLVNGEEAVALVKKYWGGGTIAHVREFPSYDDRNHCVDRDGERFILKISGPLEPAASLDCQNRAMLFLDGARAEGGIPRVPVPVFSDSANAHKVEDLILPLVNGGTGRCSARLVTFLPGTTLGDVITNTSSDGSTGGGDGGKGCDEATALALLADLGTQLARMDLDLTNFDHPYARKRTEGSGWAWDMGRCSEVVRAGNAVVAEIAGAERAAVLLSRSDEHDTALRHATSIDDGDGGNSTGTSLRRQIVHNDANLLNVLCDRDAARVTGFIDFGDIADTLVVHNIAIAAAYAMLGAPDGDTALERGAAVVRGYNAVRTIDEAEREVVFAMALMRICVSITVGLEAAKQEPGNAYLLVHLDQNWALLDQLKDISAAQGAAHLCSALTDGKHSN